MRRLVAISLLALGACVATPDLARLVVRQPELALSYTQRFEMTSASGRRFDIFVAAPQGEAPPSGWPVIYTLDANIMFGIVTDTARSYGRRSGLPGSAGVSSVVVGIGYPRDLDPARERSVDLTASTTSVPLPGAETGKAEQLITFIADELKPRIASQFQIDTTREAIFGHSYGGHFVLYGLINRPDLFDTWLAASPSIWFEDGLLKKENLRGRLQAKLEQTGATPRVLITVGQFEEATDPDFPPQSLERLLSRNQVSNAQEFATWLAAQKGMAVDFQVIAGEDHGTVIPASVGRAMRFAASPRVAAPSPAPKTVYLVTVANIAIPDSTAYLELTPDQRYALRLQVRALPELERQQWNNAFQYNLRSGLTYAQHRGLHEERQAIDKIHGTSPPDGD